MERDVCAGIQSCIVVTERRLTLNATEATQARTRIGPVQIGVILLALLAGGIHLYIWLIEGILSGLPQEQQMGPTYQFLFVGNFFGYLTLAAALYLPLSLLTRFRPVVRVLLIAMSIAAMASYFHVGFYDTLGNATQIIEALLIALLTVDAGMSSPSEELSRR